MQSQHNVHNWFALMAVVVALALTAAACPAAGEYTVKGKVTAKAGGAAIDGIAVTCQVAGGVAGSAVSGAASAADAGSAEAGVEDAGAVDPGSYLCKAPAVLGQSGTASVEVRFSDSDGAENGGEFAELSQSIEVELAGEATLDVQLEAK